jgi:cell division cycle 20-like protein 1 (cofactor of APC complex)
MNPEGDTLVTGAGDETLRFWNVFPKSYSEDSQNKSILIGDATSLR